MIYPANIIYLKTSSYSLEMENPLIKGNTESALIVKM